MNAPDDIKKIDSASMPPITKSEAQIAKDTPALKARLDETGWSDDKKASFLDLLLGKGKS